MYTVGTFAGRRNSLWIAFEVAVANSFRSSAVFVTNLRTFLCTLALGWVGAGGASSLGTVSATTHAPAIGVALFLGAGSGAWECPRDSIGDVSHGAVL